MRSLAEHRPYLLSGLIECEHCGKRFQAKRLTRGRVPAYYLCGGYVVSAVTFCDTPRIPTAYLEDAVLEGIQKRLDLVLDAEELGRLLDERLADDDAGGVAIPELEAHLHETRRRIERLVTALSPRAPTTCQVCARRSWVSSASVSGWRRTSPARASARAPVRIDASR